MQLASAPTFSTHFSLESLEEIDQYLGIPCWLLSLLIVSVLLSDSQHNLFPSPSCVIGAGLSFHLRVLNDLPHSGSFCVTGVKWKTEKKKTKNQSYFQAKDRAKPLLRFVDVG